METRRKIVIAEDHTILRAGLRALLSGQNGLEVIGEAGDGREAIRKVDTLQPDLLLIDLSMPKLNGIDAIREIKSQHPEIKIIVLTVHKSEEYIVAALQAGANGYMLKDASQNELLLAIDYVINGKTFLSPSISDKVVDAFLNTDKKDKPAAVLDNLTAREREILKLVAEGNTNKKIAEHLCISLKTVEKHRSNLMQKLDLRNTAALTAYAIAKKMVDF
ncbi:MAG: response regulator transcription factor [Desulfobulbaceae bacterium]|jgi:two-component system, NarL family, response regulator NreC|nr:response regulator transcription factor [Desulfobulbaceae bacterium]MDH3783519.1 response regulator transcription factor [Desulfobulbaceae bacterium]